MEKRIRRIIRWNAMAMVTRANKHFDAIARGGRGRANYAGPLHRQLDRQPRGHAGIAHRRIAARRFAGSADGGVPLARVLRGADRRDADDRNRRFNQVTVVFLCFVPLLCLNEKGCKFVTRGV